ncbi:MAG: hypothetical protein BCS36_04365 [Desulfovibrio sp. MES5]|uniref:HD-GYP domain-containing protein n=1 Tax=Desulfovibrio sp. MES5 TaxID=1899016 RepID=UPI000B9CE8F7|nr:response regulator [Desulfovibrio sp. MES5]OXS29401.1 MAG: hypothetical protein BCS36_04365 [Desulfovibrio sp. MES5]
MQTPLIVSIGIPQKLAAQVQRALPHCYFIHHASEDAALEDIAAQAPRIILFAPPRRVQGNRRYLFLSRLGELGLAASVPVIVLSDIATLADKKNAFSAGATEYLVQPFTNSELAVRICAGLDAHDCRQSVLQLNLRLSRAKSVFLKGTAALMAMKDAETGGHIVRVAHYTKILLEDAAIRNYYPGGLTRQDAKELSRAATLHDIGKIHLPDSLLQKPGPLTSEEFTIVKTHTLYGGELLRNLRQISDSTFLRFAEEIARAHHENWNGTGYPYNLQGEEIPCSARIMAVADVYDATRTDRVYKSAWPHAQSTQYIMDNSGILFDPTVTACFYKHLDIFKNISDNWQNFTVGSFVSI